MDSSIFFNAILRRSPMILMTLSGIVIALVRWKHHPKVSLLTLLGLGLYLVQAVVFTIVFYLVSVLTQNGRWVYTGLYLVQECFYAIMIILLVTAALSQRTSPVSAN